MSLKNYGIGHQSALLKPLKQTKNTIHFRQMIKHRNPADGIAPMPIPQMAQTVTASLRSSELSHSPSRIMHS